ncbi:DUF4296 domain-containing protein [Pseudoflavitalea sp. G-6-1-2]|uniref:DUF4296 domain-containing protein n=1 Tax=Pseudoflavitalea sp. G-6-1-2 TaxID=2728841 RepID=UPI00146BE657|nr:DUF4296 domain-containing protein [Pseudoflavitalea sp. G-6-1-2]NML22663.1 DUF4296 domain-containing protein [Pseudoflavitalea sp. G-6-1-2]
MIRVQKRKSNAMAMLIVGACLMILAACSNKNKVPSGVMDHEEMEAVMWDMIQADRYAAISFSGDSLKRNNIKDETLKVYDQVFQIHKISKEEFLKSYKFYLSRPDMLKVVFDSIATKADRRRNEEIHKPDTAKPAPMPPPANPDSTGKLNPARIKSLKDLREMKSEDTSFIPLKKKGPRRFRRPE